MFTYFFSLQQLFPVIYHAHFTDRKPEHVEVKELAQHCSAKLDSKSGLSLPLKLLHVTMKLKLKLILPIEDVL